MFSKSFPDSVNHRIFDRVIQSNIELPELENTGKSNPDIIVSLEPGNMEDHGWEHIHDWLLADGRTSISSARKDGQYLLSFPGLARFEINTERETISCHPDGDIPANTLRHLLLDQVIPRAMAHRGRLVLHGGAVTLSQGYTVAFIGDTGWGKSTVTCSFFSHGARILTDDCLLAERSGKSFSCIPSYPGIRLFPDSIEAVTTTELDFPEVSHYSNKRRLSGPLRADSRVDETPRLDAIFLLADPAKVSDSDAVLIEPLEEAEALMSIIRHSFTLDIKDRSSMRSRMETAAKLVASTSICRLQYPRTFSILPEVQQKIESYLSKTGRGMK
jgi:hypothetical protein